MRIEISKMILQKIKIEKIIFKNTLKKQKSTKNLFFLRVIIPETLREAL